MAGRRVRPRRAAAAAAAEAAAAVAEAAGRSMVRINQQQFESVKFKLGQMALRTDDLEEEDDDLHFDFSIGTATDADAFTRWTEHNKSTVLANFIDGKIIARELPNAPHGFGCAEVAVQFAAQRQGIFRSSENIDLLGRVTGSIYTPDVVFFTSGTSNRPLGSTPGSPAYPVIIVEVGCSQRPRNLQANAAVFLGPDFPSVEYYLGLKRYDTRVDGSQCLVATFYTRAAAAAAAGNNAAPAGNNAVLVDVVSFGTGHVDGNSDYSNHPLLRGVGVPGHPPCTPGVCVLTFLAARLFSSRVGGIPAGAQDITLDLFLVQQGLTTPSMPL